MDNIYYWSRTKELNLKEFKKAVSICEKICKILKVEYNIELTSWDRNIPNAIFTDEKVMFNDKFKNSANNFYIPRVDNLHISNKDGFCLWFCNTNGYPYQLAVQCCLLVFSFCFPDEVKISTQKDRNKWEKAITITNNYFNNNFLEIDLKLESELISKSKNLETNKVVLNISEGAAYMIEKPLGTDVVIRDYDIEGCDAESSKNCKQDEDGDWYQEMLWEAKEQFP